MEFPGSIFTRTARRTLLGVFIFVFCVTAPLVILTTAGYRFDWRNHHLIFKGTGSISVDILPKNATVYLNGIRLSGSMPYRVNALTPDMTYTLRVASPGYYDWQKDITVIAGETYYLKDISMLKRTNPVVIATGTIQYVSVSPSGASLVYQARNNTGADIWLTDTATNHRKLIQHFASDPRVVVTWDSTSDHALIKSATRDWFLLTIGDASLKNLHSLTNATVSNALWNSTANASLYLSSSTTLWSYQVNTGLLQVVGTLPSPVWYAESNSIWSFRASTSTNEWLLIGDVFGFADTVARFSATDLGPINAWHIEAVKNNTALLSHDGSNEYLLITNNTKHKIPATHFIISPFNSWWIFWSPTELWTYARGEEPKLLNRTGELLSGVVPLDQYNTLALGFEKRTSALYPYYLISHDLLPGARAVAADPNHRTLFWSGTYRLTDGLWELNY